MICRDVHDARYRLAIRGLCESEAETLQNYDREFREEVCHNVPGELTQIETIEGTQ